MKNKALIVIVVMILSSLACSFFANPPQSNNNEEPSNNPQSSAPPTANSSIDVLPPSYGVFLLQNGDYIELQRYEGDPDKNDKGIYDTNTANPVFIMYVPELKQEYVIVRTWGSAGDDVSASIELLGEDVLRISINQELQVGTYCIVQGDPLGVPYSLPTWCFRIPNGTSHTDKTGVYSWRAFPVKVQESIGDEYASPSENYIQAGWKYLGVDLAVESLDNSGNVDVDFREAISAMTLINDGGFVYQPMTKKLIEYGFDYWGIIGVNKGNDESYICLFCWWPDSGFVFSAWISPPYQNQNIPPLDYPQSPMHVLFRVPENSKSYTLIVPDGLAVQPGEFQFSVESEISQVELPFSNNWVDKVLSVQDEILFSKGVMKLLDVSSTESELLIRFSFENASAGYQATGGANGILLDDRGVAYDVLDWWHNDRVIEWDAGPGQTIEGVAAYPLPVGAEKLWLVLPGFYKEADLFYDDNFVIVALPIP